MKIINREPNFDGTCQRINSKGEICKINKKTLSTLMEPFTELKKVSDTSSIEDLKKSSEIVKERQIAKARILKKQQNSGYILISSLTCVGTLVVGAIIFMTIKLIIFK